MGLFCINIFYDARVKGNEAIRGISWGKNTFCINIIFMESVKSYGGNMTDLFRVGVIANTHGVRGEVKVFPTTQEPERFKKLKDVILDTGKEKIDLEVKSVRFFKNLVIVKFKGIDNINDIENIKAVTFM